MTSCEEDEDKVIQTDLPTEAAQLFSISTDWNESLYFAMLSWEEYQQIDSVALPSCPEVSLDKDTKEVTLNFLASTTCAQTGEYGRSGKLVIKFDTTVTSPARKWTMRYDDYFFGTRAISGTRTFSSEDDSLQVSEEFADLIEKTENELSTEFEGKFLHTRLFSKDSSARDSLSGLASTGRITGVNAAGRAFEIAIETPVLHNISCYTQNEILPSSGLENWFVSRKGNSEAIYSVSYEALLGDCSVSANATLPDGKKLLLNPSGE